MGDFKETNKFVSKMILEKLKENQLDDGDMFAFMLGCPIEGEGGLKEFKKNSQAAFDKGQTSYGQCIKLNRGNFI
jgi:hypothetical protein